MILSIYTDGGSRGNPGPSGIGGVYYLQDTEVASFSEFIGTKTNNEAEYQAFFYSLEWLIAHIDNYDVTTIRWYLDSKLVVEQLNGRWKIKEQRLQEVASVIKNNLERLSVPYLITHVPRKENSVADALVNKALDAHLD